MRICETCKTQANEGYADLRGMFVCKKCYDPTEKYLVDRLKITENGIEEKPPFDEEKGRDYFIHYCDSLFNGLAKRAYSQMKNMKEKYDYTWLGMARAIEYFYIIKKNNIAKAKKGIGIIPYVYQDAQKFYLAFNAQNYKKALDLKRKLEKQKEKEDNVVSVKTKTNRPKIDISQL